MNAVEALPKYFYFMTKKSKGYTYMLQYDGNEWKPGSRYAAKINPRIIGKINSASGSGLILFTADFVEKNPIFKTAAVERRLSPQTNKWELHELESMPHTGICTSLMEQDPHGVKAVLRIGTYMLYMKLLQGDPLLNCLKAVFPDHWEKMLSAAFFCLDLADGMIARRYKRYSAEYKLPYQDTLTPKDLTVLFEAITEVSVRSFFVKYTEALYTKHSLKGRRFWALDSTSISTYGGLIDASYGKNKQEENLPQVNIMMLADEGSGRPLFYETFDGSIPDVSKACSTFDSLLHIGAKAFVAVMDRGFYSLFNLQGIISMGFHFLVCVPIDKVTLFKDTIVKASLAFTTGDCYDRALDQNVFTDEKQVSVKLNGKDTELTLYVHVFYDQERAGAQTKAIQRRRDFIMAKLKEHVTLDADNHKFADTYLTQHEDGSITCNKAAFQEANNRAGIFVVVSDVVKDGRIAYKAYRARRTVEDCFSSLKVRLNCSRFLVSSEASLTGKCFIEFLAVSLYMRISRQLHNLKEKGKETPHHDVPGLIDDLKGVKAFYYKDGYVQVSTLSKQQKDCLRMFGIKEPVSHYDSSVPLPNMKRYARKPHGDGSQN